MPGADSFGRRFTNYHSEGQPPYRPRSSSQPITACGKEGLLPRDPFYYVTKHLQHFTAAERNQSCQACICPPIDGLVMAWRSACQSSSPRSPWQRQHCTKVSFTTILNRNRTSQDAGRWSSSSYDSCSSYNSDSGSSLSSSFDCGSSDSGRSDEGDYGGGD